MPANRPTPLVPVQADAHPDPAAGLPPADGPALEPTGSRDGPLLWTITDVCAALQCTPSWIYDQVEADRFPVLRLGRQLRFRPADITSWLDGQYQPPRPDQPQTSARPRHRRRPPAGPPTNQPHPARPGG